MGSNPAWDTGLSRFADHHAERAALLRHDPSPFIRTAEVSIRRSGAESSNAVPGNLEPSWSRRISPRRGEACAPWAERWQDDLEGIRDRVTISSWSLPGTATPHETYDRNGNLSLIVHPPASTGSGTCAQTIRCQVTLMMVRIADGE